MLKSLRIVIAVIAFTFLSALFLDCTKTVPLAFHVFAHLQIISLIQAKLVGVLLLWFVLTALFGRFYCSMLCPFGVFQDILSGIAKMVRRKKANYHFRPEMYKTRRFFLLLLIAGIIAMPVFVSILDPYSNYGRLITFLVRPVFLTCNNYLAIWKPDWFSVTTFSSAPIPAILFTLVITLFVGVTAFVFGRRYCNTICPIGTLLGLFAKVSLFRIRLSAGCVSCGLCEKVCKGECIDSKSKNVDVSRCVDCFNCLSVCRKRGISFGLPSGTSVPVFEQPIVQGVPVAPRRTFLQWLTASLFFGSAAQAATLPNGLPTGQSRISYQRNHPVLPPGAKSRGHLTHHCTACQLCVAKCPSNVLQPSITDLGLQGFLVPVMKFEHGFCNYHCIICTQVCPTAALTSLSAEEKYKLQVGNVVFLEENCVVKTQEVNCGACAEHCPTGAVKMRPYGPPGSVQTIPEVDADLCVGCGACESICPVVPYKAIYVDGLEKHGEAKPAFDPNEKQQEFQLDSFGF